MIRTLAHAAAALCDRLDRLSPAALVATALELACIAAFLAAIAVVAIAVGGEA